MLAVASTSKPVSREVHGLLRGSAVSAVSAKGRQLQLNPAEEANNQPIPVMHTSAVWDLSQACLNDLLVLNQYLCHLSPLLSLDGVRSSIALCSSASFEPGLYCLTARAPVSACASCLTLAALLCLGCPGYCIFILVERSAILLCMSLVSTCSPP